MPPLNEVTIAESSGSPDMAGSDALNFIHDKINDYKNKKHKSFKLFCIVRLKELLNDDNESTKNESFSRAKKYLTYLFKIDERHVNQLTPADSVELLTWLDGFPDEKIVDDYGKTYKKFEQFSPGVTTNFEDNFFNKSIKLLHAVMNFLKSNAPERGLKYWEDRDNISKMIQAQEIAEKKGESSVHEVMLTKDFIEAIDLIKQIEKSHAHLRLFFNEPLNDSSYRGISYQISLINKIRPIIIELLREILTDLKSYSLESFDVCRVFIFEIIEHLNNDKQLEMDESKLNEIINGIAEKFAELESEKIKELKEFSNQEDLEYQKILNEMYFDRNLIEISEKMIETEKRFEQNTSSEQKSKEVEQIRNSLNELRNKFITVKQSSLKEKYNDKLIKIDSDANEECKKTKIKFGIFNEETIDRSTLENPSSATVVVVERMEYYKHQLSIKNFDFFPETRYQRMFLMANLIEHSKDNFNKIRKTLVQDSILDEKQSEELKHDVASVAPLLKNYLNEFFLLYIIGQEESTNDLDRDNANKENIAYSRNISNIYNFIFKHKNSIIAASIENDSNLSKKPINKNKKQEELSDVINNILDSLNALSESLYFYSKKMINEKEFEDQFNRTLDQLNSFPNFTIRNIILTQVIKHHYDYIIELRKKTLREIFPEALKSVDEFQFDQFQAIIKARKNIVQLEEEISNETISYDEQRIRNYLTVRMRVEKELTMLQEKIKLQEKDARGVVVSDELDTWIKLLNHNVEMLHEQEFKKELERKISRSINDLIVKLLNMIIETHEIIVLDESDQLRVVETFTARFTNLPEKVKSRFSLSEFSLLQKNIENEIKFRLHEQLFLYNYRFLKDATNSLIKSIGQRISYFRSERDSKLFSQIDKLNVLKNHLKGGLKYLAKVLDKFTASQYNGSQKELSECLNLINMLITQFSLAEEEFKILEKYTLDAINSIGAPDLPFPRTLVRDLNPLQYISTTSLRKKIDFESETYLTIIGNNEYALSFKQYLMFLFIKSLFPEEIIDLNMLSHENVDLYDYIFRQSRIKFFRINKNKNWNESESTSQWNRKVLEILIKLFENLSQNSTFRNILLSTGKAYIYHDTSVFVKDINHSVEVLKLLGIYSDGEGKNLVGHALMHVRDTILARENGEDLDFNDSIRSLAELRDHALKEHQAVNGALKVNDHQILGYFDNLYCVMNVYNELDEMKRQVNIFSSSDAVPDIVSAYQFFFGLYNKVDEALKTVETLKPACPKEFKKKIDEFKTQLVMQVSAFNFALLNKLSYRRKLRDIRKAYEKLGLVTKAQKVLGKLNKFLEFKILSGDNEYIHQKITFITPEECQELQQYIHTEKHILSFEKLLQEEQNSRESINGIFTLVKNNLISEKVRRSTDSIFNEAVNDLTLSELQLMLNNFDLSAYRAKLKDSKYGSPLTDNEIDEFPDFQVTFNQLSEKLNKVYIESKFNILFLKITENLTQQFSNNISNKFTALTLEKFHEELTSSKYEYFLSRDEINKFPENFLKLKLSYLNNDIKMKLAVYKFKLAEQIDQMSIEIGLILRFLKSSLDRVVYDHEINITSIPLLQQYIIFISSTSTDLNIEQLNELRTDFSMLIKQLNCIIPNCKERMELIKKLELEHDELAQQLLTDARNFGSASMHEAYFGALDANENSERNALFDQFSKLKQEIIISKLNKSLDILFEKEFRTFESEFFDINYSVLEKKIIELSKDDFVSKLTEDEKTLTKFELSQLEDSVLENIFQAFKERLSTFLQSLRNHPLASEPNVEIQMQKRRKDVQVSVQSVVKTKKDVHYDNIKISMRNNEERTRKEIQEAETNALRALEFEYKFPSLNKSILNIYFGKLISAQSKDSLKKVYNEITFTGYCDLLCIFGVVDIFTDKMLENATKSFSEMHKTLTLFYYKKLLRLNYLEKLLTSIRGLKECLLQETLSNDKFKQDSLRKLESATTIVDLNSAYDEINFARYRTHLFPNEIDSADEEADESACLSNDFAKLHVDLTSYYHEKLSIFQNAMVTSPIVPEVSSLDDSSSSVQFDSLNDLLKTVIDDRKQIENAVYTVGDHHIHKANLINDSSDSSDTPVTMDTAAESNKALSYQVRMEYKNNQDDKSGTLDLVVQKEEEKDYQIQKIKVHALKGNDDEEKRAAFRTSLLLADQTGAKFIQISRKMPKEHVTLLIEEMEKLKPSFKSEKLKASKIQNKYGAIDFTRDNNGKVILVKIPTSQSPHRLFIERKVTPCAQALLSALRS